MNEELERNRMVIMSMPCGRDSEAEMGSDGGAGMARTSQEA